LVTPKKIALLGKNGQVGHELLLCCQGLAEITAVGREDLDLQDLAAVARFLEELRPDLVINAAAYTAVDRAEKERDAAVRMNADLPRLLADLCRQHGSALIHYSTDYVYDGVAGEPYAEARQPSPLNFYGVSKLAGDEAIQQSGAAHLIFRTCWVYSARGRNFLRAILDKWSSGGVLRVVNDQVGSPTTASLIAETTAQVIAMVAKDSNSRFSEALQPKSGVYHLSASGSASWYDFAKAFLPEYAEQSGRLLPIATSEYPTPARRPAYSVLSTEKLQRTFGLAMPHWSHELRKLLQNMQIANLGHQES
jgi:dTDP-4-dehydrorhamnose reductase